MAIDPAAARAHVAGMDPRILPMQIASGILLAAFVILLVRLGMNIYRSNTGLRGLFGAAMFISGLALGWALMLGAVMP